MPNDDESLEAHWGDIRGIPVKPPRPEDLNTEGGPEVGPNDLVIATSLNRLLVVLRPDGTFEYGKDYTPDEAAVVFWETMARRRVEYEERMILFQQMEVRLLAVGEADLANEQRVLARDEEGLDRLEKDQRAQRAQISLSRLEMQVHQMMELGRAMALSRRGQSRISEDNARAMAEAMASDVPPHRRG